MCKPDRREGYLQRHLRYGGKLLGICGGYQMLGERIADPLGLEGEAGESAGLGYLPTRTRLEAEKALRNVTGELMLAGERVPISGYEIHSGVTEVADGCPALVQLENEQQPVPDGACSEDEQVVGTYLHGLFETPEVTRLVLRWAGLDGAQALDYHQLREDGINRLADTLEQHLDLDAVMTLLDLSGEREGA